MVEREHIIQFITERLWELENSHNIQVVSRDLRAIPNLSTSDLPALFLVDLGDDVEKDSGIPTPNYQRAWRIGIITVIQGTSEDEAPHELAVLQKAIKDVLYADNRQVGTTYKGRIREKGLSELYFPESGNAVVAQGMEFEILYVEDVSRSF